MNPRGRSIQRRVKASASDSFHNPALLKGQGKSQRIQVSDQGPKPGEAWGEHTILEAELESPQPPEQTACQRCLVEGSACLPALETCWKATEQQHPPWGPASPPPLGHASVPLLTPDASWLMSLNKGSISRAHFRNNRDNTTANWAENWKWREREKRGKGEKKQSKYNNH